MPTTEAMSAFGTVNTGGQLAEDPSNLFFEDDDYVDDDDDDEGTAASRGLRGRV